MNTGVKIKLQGKTFFVDSQDVDFLSDFLRFSDDRRTKKLFLTMSAVKEKTVQENPNLTELQVEQELSYILKQSGYHPADIARFLKLGRTHVYKNEKVVENALWAEQRSGISEKTMKKRIEAMKTFSQSLVTQKK